MGLEWIGNRSGMGRDQSHMGTGTAQDGLRGKEKLNLREERKKCAATFENAAPTALCKLIHVTSHQ